MSEECDHKDKWHIAPGPYKIVRFCGGCGKSWWIPARDDTLSFGDTPIAEWEPIRERMEVEQLVKPSYDESAELDDEDLDDPL